MLSRHDNEDMFDVRGSRKEGHDHAELFDQAAVQRMMEMWVLFMGDDLGEQHSAHKVPILYVFNRETELVVYCVKVNMQVGCHQSHT